MITRFIPLGESFIFCREENDKKFWKNRDSRAKISQQIYS